MTISAFWNVSASTVLTANGLMNILYQHRKNFKLNIPLLYLKTVLPIGLSAVQWATAVKVGTISIQYVCILSSYVFLLSVPSRSTHVTVAGSVDVVKLLLERGADPSSGDCNGATPLHCAARLKDPAVATLLLTRGAPWDKKDAHGLSPLLCSAIKGASRVVRALHAHGAPLDVPAANGITGNSGRRGENN